MPVFHKVYEVISPRAVMVEHAGGESKIHAPGDRFIGNPATKCIVRLLRTNSIREVASREIPNLES